MYSTRNTPPVCVCLDCREDECFVCETEGDWAVEESDCSCYRMFWIKSFWCHRENWVIPKLYLKHEESNILLHLFSYFLGNIRMFPSLGNTRMFSSISNTLTSSFLLSLCSSITLWLLSCVICVNVVFIMQMRASSSPVIPSVLACFTLDALKNIFIISKQLEPHLKQAHNAGSVNALTR